MPDPIIAQENQRISLALNAIGQRRDIGVQGGDSLRLTVDVYQNEDDKTVDPVSLAGVTLTFERACFPSQLAIAAGNVFTFTPSVPAYYAPRTPYRIVMTDSNGLRVTLCYGHVITLGRPDRAAWGLLGDDYGWWPR